MRKRLGDPKHVFRPSFMVRAMPSRVCARGPTWVPSVSTTGSSGFLIIGLMFRGRLVLLGPASQSRSAATLTCLKLTRPTHDRRSLPHARGRPRRAVRRPDLDGRPQDRGRAVMRTITPIRSAGSCSASRPGVSPMRAPACQGGARFSMSRDRLGLPGLDRAAVPASPHCLGSRS